MDFTPEELEEYRKWLEQGKSLEELDEDARRAKLIQAEELARAEKVASKPISTLGESAPSLRDVKISEKIPPGPGQRVGKKALEEYVKARSAPGKTAEQSAAVFNEVPKLPGEIEADKTDLRKEASRLSRKQKAEKKALEEYVKAQSIPGKTAKESAETLGVVPERIKSAKKSAQVFDGGGLLETPKVGELVKDEIKRRTVEVKKPTSGIISEATGIDRVAPSAAESAKAFDETSPAKISASVIKKQNPVIDRLLNAQESALSGKSAQESAEALSSVVYPSEPQFSTSSKTSSLDLSKTTEPKFKSPPILSKAAAPTMEEIAEAQRKLNSSSLPSVGSKLGKGVGALGLAADITQGDLVGAAIDAVGYVDKLGKFLPGLSRLTPSIKSARIAAALELLRPTDTQAAEQDSRSNIEKLKRDIKEEEEVEKNRSEFLKGLGINEADFNYQSALSGTPIESMIKFKDPRELTSAGQAELFSEASAKVAAADGESPSFFPFKSEEDKRLALAEMSRPKTAERSLASNKNGDDTGTSVQIPSLVDEVPIKRKEETDILALLERAKQARDQQQLLAGLGRAGETLSSAISGMARGGTITKSMGTDFYKDLAKQAENYVEDVGSQVKLEKIKDERDTIARKRDPLSSESKFARDLLKNQGISVPEGSTAEILEKYAPWITNLYNQKENREYRAFQSELARQDRLRQEAIASGEKKEKLRSEEKQKLEKRLAEPSATLSALNNLESNIRTDYLKDPNFSLDTFNIKEYKGDLPGSNIPGLGRTSFYSSDARQLQRDLETVLNQMIRSFAGKAVTKNELERIKTQFSSGVFNNEEEMLGAMAQAKKLFREGMKSAEAAFSKEAVEEYKEGGGITSEYGLERSPQKEKDPEIQEYANQYFKGDYDRAVRALKLEGQL
jgi:hypothetical protein